MAGKFGKRFTVVTFTNSGIPIHATPCADEADARNVLNARRVNDPSNSVYHVAFDDGFVLPSAHETAQPAQETPRELSFSEEFALLRETLTEVFGARLSRVDHAAMELVARSIARCELAQEEARQERVQELDAKVFGRIAVRAF